MSTAYMYEYQVPILSAYKLTFNAQNHRPLYGLTAFRAWYARMEWRYHQPIYPSIGCRYYTDLHSRALNADITALHLQALNAGNTGQHSLPLYTGQLMFYSDLYILKWWIRYIKSLCKDNSLPIGVRQCRPIGVHHIYLFHYPTWCTPIGRLSPKMEIVSVLV